MTLVCKTCGKKAGGLCCGCDEPTCTPCMMTVKMVTSTERQEYRHRCATCAAMMVLTENVEATWPTLRTA